MPGPLLARLASLPAEQIFWGVVGLHAVLWTVLPILVHTNGPLDVIEGMAWGREWQLGYHKGPPLFAWIMGAIDPLPPEWRLAAVFLISQLCVATTFYGAWRLAGRLFSRSGALLSVLLMEGVYYFGFPAPELNPIIVQMPISALLGWIFHRAVVEDRWRDWLLVGLLAALGMWARYSTGLLLATLGLFLLLPSNWPSLRRPGPWIALFCFALLWSPHLHWMLASRLQSVGYVAGRAHQMGDGWERLVVPLRFALAQALALLPALLLALAVRRWPIDRSPALATVPVTTASRDRAYILLVALGPFVLAVLASLASGLGLRSMWGGPLWCFAGLLAVQVTRPVLGRESLRRFVVAWPVVFALPLAAYAIANGVRPLVVENEKRSSFPGPALAAEVTHGWRDATGGAQPLRHVVGTMWLAGNVAFYSRDRPSVFEELDLRRSPWVDPAAIDRDGAVLVWQLDRTGAPALPDDLAARFPAALVQEPLLLAKRCRCPGKRVRIGWAIVAPADGP